MNLYFPKAGLLDPTNVPTLVRSGKGDFYEGMSIRFDDSIPVRSGADVTRSLILRDNNDFAPRIGLAYSPTDKWTVRSGFGVFLTQDTGNPRFDMGRNLAGRSNLNANPERPNMPLADPWRDERTSGRCSGWSGLCQSLPTIFANNVDRPTPYVMQYMFNVQRQLTRNVALEVGYLGNGGRKLERISNTNVAVRRTGADDFRTLVQRRPWGSIYGPLQAMGNMGSSNYNALSLKLQQQFSKGLTYMVGYTWSKAIDFGSAIRTNPGDGLIPMNVYDLRAERGLSQFHVGRRLVTSFIYEIPNVFDNQIGE